MLPGYSVRVHYGRKPERLANGAAGRELTAARRRDRPPAARRWRLRENLVTGKAGTGTIIVMEPATWMLDELAHAGPEHLDPGFVAGFDRKQGYPGFSADVSVLAAHGAGQDATVVDLGTGTGRFALAAAPHVRHVVAVDVSPAMLAVARDRAAAAGLASIEWVQAGFLSYQHAGPPTDAVFTRNALHQLPDFWKALALDRIAGMLRPGGVLRLHDLIFDFQPADAGTVLERWLDGAAADPASGYTREDYAGHLRTEHSTFRWLLEPMLTAAGFDIVTAGFDRQVYGAYTCVRR
jgi:ubiquinone/menaquinone biosynthesis C-methylase UbiE